MFTIVFLKDQIIVQVNYKIRNRWLKGATSFLTVSRATASDISQLLPVSRFNSLVSSCSASVFAETISKYESFQLWNHLKTVLLLPDTFLLLPASSAIGSYKNPEFLAEALSESSLSHFPSALWIVFLQRALELQDSFPHLNGRIYSAGFTDQELALAYHHATLLLSQAG